jgi:hypothetical protein
VHERTLIPPCGPAWEAARQQLIRLLREEAVHYGPVTVGRGMVLDVFVDMSRVTLLSPGLSLIEALLGPKLAKLPQGATSFQPIVFSMFLLLLLSGRQSTPEQWRQTI